jgi:hypothetical protein
VYGRSEFSQTTYELSTRSNDTIVAFEGVDGDLLGSSLSGIGDINKDGVDDFIIGAYSHNSQLHNRAGCVYLIYGRSFQLDTLVLESLDAPLAGGSIVRLVGEGKYYQV